MLKTKSVVKALTFFMLLACTIALFVGCKSEPSKGRYSLPAENTIEVGVPYTPDFGLKGNTTATVLEVKGPSATYVQNQGLTFTPDVAGKYTYTVRFAGDGFTKDEAIVFNAVDTVAPQIVESPAHIQVELGYFGGLHEHLLSCTVKDAGAKIPSIYFNNVTFNGTAAEIAGDLSGYFFARPGEYTFGFTVEDYSGNRTEGSFKITVTDKQSPVVYLPGTVISWLNNGKVVLPQPLVTEISNVTVSATATDAKGNQVTVENGCLLNAVKGKYSVTYVAADAYGNESEPLTVTLLVKEKGVISDFSDEGEVELWGNSTVLKNGKLHFSSDQKQADITFAEFFPKTDEQFTSLSFDIENISGNPLTVTPYILSDGKWVQTASVLIRPATLDPSGLIDTTPGKDTVRVYFADYEIKNAEGVRIVLSTDTSVAIRLDNVRLDSRADDRVLPNEDSLGGIAFGKFEILSGKEVFIPVNAPVPSGSNSVSYRIYAKVPQTVSVLLEFGDKTVFATHRLEAGWNDFVRVPSVEIENHGTLTSVLTGIRIVNDNPYHTTVVLDGVSFDKTNRLDDSFFRLTADELFVESGKLFTVKNYILADSRYYTDLKITLVRGSNRREVELGTVLSTNDGSLNAGIYSLEYSFKDTLTGATHTVVCKLGVQKNILSLKVDTPPLFLEGAELPQVQLLSDVYSSNQLRKAVVHKYYREKGKYVWRSADESFSPDKTKWYEIRYTVEFEDQTREFVFEKFIHKNAWTIDFEREDAAGENRILVNYVTGEKYGKEQSQFLYDGGYYNYNGDPNLSYVWRTSTDWAKSGTTSIGVTQYFYGYTGFLIRPVIVSEEGASANAISFWLKSDIPMSQTVIDIGVSARDLELPYCGKWVTTEPFDVYQGEHYYTVYFSEPVTVSDVCTFSILGKAGNTMYFDDIEFKSVNRLTMEMQEQGNQYDISSPIEMNRPIITSDVFSAEDLKNASWQLTYTYGDVDTKVMPDSNGRYLVKFPKGGKVTMTWTVTVNGVTITQNDSFFVGMVDLETSTPRAVRFGEKVKLIAPKSLLKLETLEVFYRSDIESDWHTAQKNGDEFFFTAEQSGSYYVRYVATAKTESGTTINGEVIDRVRVSEPGLIFTFEEDDPLRGGKTYFESLGVVITAGKVQMDENGNSVFTLFPNMDAWDGLVFENGYDLGYDTTALKVTITSPREIKALPIEIQLTEDLRWYHLDIDVKSGTHEYVLDFAECGADNIRHFKALIFRLLLEGGGTIYSVDDIGLVPELIDPNYESTREYGNQMVIRKPEIYAPWVSSDTLKKTAVYSLEYSLNGGEKKKVLPNSDGEFTATFAEPGTVEVFWTVEIEGAVMSGRYSFSVGVIELVTATPDVVRLQQEVRLDLPTSEFAIRDSKIEYLAPSASQWVEVASSGAQFAFVPTETGKYLIRYTATDVTGGMGLKIDTLYVTSRDVIFSFEEKDPLQGGIPYSEFTNAPIVSFTVQENENGEHTMRLFPYMDSWDGMVFTDGYDLGVDTTKLKLTITSDKAIKALPIEIKLMNDNKWYHLEIDIQEGTHEYVLDFAGAGAENIRYLNILIFRLLMTGGGTIYFIDNISIVQ